MRLLLLLFCTLVATSLAAQASLAINGQTNQYTEDIHLIEVDFGATPVAVTLQLDISATSGPGVDVRLQDLDGLLDNTGTQEDTDSGSGALSLGITTGTMSGVHQFFVWVTSRSFDDASNYSGTLSTSTLPPNSIAIADTQTISLNAVENIVHGRMWAIRGTADGVYTDTFKANASHIGFPRDLRYHLSANGSAMASIELRERSSGSTQIITTLSAPGNAQGVVGDSAGREVHVVFNSAGAGDINVYLLLGNEAEVYFAQCDYGCGNSGACSVSDANSSLHVLLVLLTLMAVSIRRRQTAS
ncbi:MAG: hypothetical protein ACYTDT_00160 [Planctomycetota bacterium]|jgi:hypothetical protein